MAHISRSPEEQSLGLDIALGRPLAEGEREQREEHCG